MIYNSIFQKSLVIAMTIGLLLGGCVTGCAQVSPASGFDIVAWN